MNCYHLNEGEQFGIISVGVVISLILLQSITDEHEYKFTLDFINYCCTGYILHRCFYHLMFFLNIDVFRSLTYAISFWYSIILLLSSIYGVATVNKRLNGSTPNVFSEFDFVKVIQGLMNQK